MSSLTSISWQARTFSAAGYDTTVYIGTADEVEWSLNDVTSWFWTSADSGSRVSRYRTHADRINAQHEEIYDGQELPPMRPLMQEKQPESAAAASMYERTIKTSTLCASIAALLSCPHFAADVYVRSAEIVHSLLSSLCNRSMVSNLQVPVLGQPNTFTVPANGVLRSADVWGVVIRQVLEARWAKSASDAMLTWHRSTHQSMTVPEFVLFGLDPSVLKEFSFLRIAAEQLLRQILATCTAESILEATNSVTLKRCSNVGATKQVRKGMVVRAYFDACQMVFRGEVACLLLLRLSSEEAECGFLG